MSGLSPEAEATRLRPLSGGLWSLISWLRRDEAGASSDSLSSAGSDRTVASFAFLSPDRYHHRHPPAPLLLPPPGPPTDSYKKRVHDTSSRLQQDRDLTLHRKYGLFRGDGHDAFSLPPARKFLNENRDRGERERRATSECLQRRAAHVPGKRRAPPPPPPPPPPGPGRAATLGAPRRSRKRRAPQPPRPLGVPGRHAAIREEPLATRPSTDPGEHRPPLPNAEAMDCKPEKYIKKENKDSKPRIERSFFRQIFESRKRNSAVDAVPERILPSISELDKQATEIMESCKLKALDPSDRTAGTSGDLVTPSRGDMWFCTRCLRKYDDSVVTCRHCVTEQKMKLNKVPGDGDRRVANRASNPYTQTKGENDASTSLVSEAEEKQKLKEMLKEIRDSLPKRPKHDANVIKENNSATADQQPKPSVIEAPTLRIGSTIKPVNIDGKPDRNVVKIVRNLTSSSAMETAIVTQPIVFQHVPSRDIIKLEHFNITNVKREKPNNKSPDVSNKRNESIGPSISSKDTNVPISKHISNVKPPGYSNDPLNTPLKISSLLYSNPLPETVQSSRDQQKVNQTTASGIKAKLLVSREQTTQKPLKANITTQTSNAVSDTSVKFKPNAMSIKEGPSNQELNNFPNLERDHEGKNALSNITTTSAQSFLSGAQPNTVSLSSNLPVDTKKRKTKKDINQPLKSQSQNRGILPINLEQDHEGENALPSITATSTKPSVVGDTPSTVTFSHNPLLDSKEGKVNSKENQPLKLQSQNPPRVISDELPKFYVPRVLDNHERNTATKVVPFDQHSRRRTLINQLEQSIAKGDEQAAANAAAKLAQLRLSCSVLSFSSQIVGALPTSSSSQTEKPNETTSKKINIADSAAVPSKLETQRKPPEKIPNMSSKGVAASETQSDFEKKAVPSQSQFRDIEQTNKPASSQRQTFAEPSTSKQSNAPGNDTVSIEIWIEDREATRGPIRLNMPKLSVVGDLRRQANASFGLAAHLQRWIVGRTLCTDDNTRLEALAGPQFDAPFYLCLVEPETNKHTTSRLRASPASSNTENKNPCNEREKKTSEENTTTDVYAELVLLDRYAVVPNSEQFECGVCMENYNAGEGAVLRECVHTFCRECLADVVKHSAEPVVSCPATGCPGILQEREIRALVLTEDYEKWLARGLAAAESGTRNSFHCRTRDCHGWALCEPGVTRFPCPVCKRTNCVSCQAIHEGDTCDEYRTKQRALEAVNRAQEETDEGTKAFLDTLISRGEALECPECSAIITKKWGCDWIKCSACKTEICWVTRGRRWGPGGRGDTSAGCRCGVEGKRCHPSCGYCH